MKYFVRLTPTPPALDIQRGWCAQAGVAYPSVAEWIDSGIIDLDPTPYGVVKYDEEDNYSDEYLELVAEKYRLWEFPTIDKNGRAVVLCAPMDYRLNAGSEIAEDEALSLIQRGASYSELAEYVCIETGTGFTPEAEILYQTETVGKNGQIWYAYIVRDDI